MSGGLGMRLQKTFWDMCGPWRGTVCQCEVGRNSESFNRDAGFQVEKKEEEGVGNLDLIAGLK